MKISVIYWNDWYILLVVCRRATAWGYQRRLVREAAFPIQRSQGLRAAELAHQLLHGGTALRGYFTFDASDHEPWVTRRRCGEEYNLGHDESIKLLVVPSPPLIFSLTDMGQRVLKLVRYYFENRPQFPPNFQLSYVYNSLIYIINLDCNSTFVRNCLSLPRYFYSPFRRNLPFICFIRV